MITALVALALFPFALATVVGICDRVGAAVERGMGACERASKAEVPWHVVIFATCVAVAILLKVTA